MDDPRETCITTNSAAGSPLAAPGPANVNSHLADRRHLSAADLFHVATNMTMRGRGVSHGSAGRQRRSPAEADSVHPRSGAAARHRVVNAAPDSMIIGCRLTARIRSRRTSTTCLLFWRRSQINDANAAA